jgi:hypothetical protein
MVAVELDRSVVTLSGHCIVKYGQYQFTTNNNCVYKNDHTVRYFGVRISQKENTKSMISEIS